MDENQAVELASKINFDNWEWDPKNKLLNHVAEICEIAAKVVIYQIAEQGANITWYQDDSITITVGPLILKFNKADLENVEEGQLWGEGEFTLLDKGKWP